MENRKLLNTLLPLGIILIAVAIRLLPHPANFAPISAMALFGGAYLNRKYALLFPLAAMFISDLFLGFHNTIPFVYGSFLLSGLIGLSIRNHRRAQYILAGSLLSSITFFLITNFGVWLVGGLYPHTLPGLIDCFYLAIPFFRNTLLGDLFYTGVFFSLPLLLPAIEVIL